MKKIISVCLYICLMSGCDKSFNHGRPANAVVEDKGSECVETHSLASDTSNAPASALQPTPTPTPTVRSKPNSDHLEELCGKGNVYPYFLHSALSYAVNTTLLVWSAQFNEELGKFLGILRMSSVFSFPVHVALTNHSLLLKSKISLAFLAADTLLSLINLKVAKVTALVLAVQFIFEFVRVIAYPHIWFSISNVGV
ncbi:MAG: hypothetical protein LE179_05040 [Endomicrobium sp.]|nr:hypothetical protein [Endomicrobium sp.]